ncbi:hypothetical protein Tco_1408843 [Tanacetum coccineum]
MVSIIQTYTMSKLSPSVTVLSHEDVSRYLNENPDDVMTDLLNELMYTETQTISAVPLPKDNPEVHDDVLVETDPPKNREGENKKRRQKGDGESSLKKEGNRFHDDLRKRLPLEGPLGRKTILIRYFFNKDLEYLMHGNKEKKYALSLSKVKAARYEQEGIEEMIPHLWSLSIQIYDRDAELDNLYGHGYLKESVVKRADKKGYMFTKADIPRLNQNDIKDLYILKIQYKIHNLVGIDEYDLTNAQLLYIKRIVIRKRVEDAQLGVESYQTKLNLTKPWFDMNGLHLKQLYTTVRHPKGVVYMGKDNHKMLMRANELHNFSDGTLNKVYDKLDVMLKANVMGYCNKGLEDRKWTRKDKERTESMLIKNEKTLKERRRMRRLECFVEGRRNETCWSL